MTQHEQTAAHTYNKEAAELFGGFGTVNALPDVCWFLAADDRGSAVDEDEDEHAHAANDEKHTDQISPIHPDTILCCDLCNTC